ncbi:adenylyltransferase/cytidyltransferase family protein [Polaribacter sp.]|nr:adenylyltransferase/cytidyltransferase family protein [Polaribacter sp.]
MKIGYATGVFDLFHVGHLNLLKTAKSLCDKLIVGVTVDELVKYKGKISVIPFEERLRIVDSIKYVDSAIPQYNMDKIVTCKKLSASILFVGDDWFDNVKWKNYEKEFSEVGGKIIYIPYTSGTSSTLINSTLETLRNQ